MTNKLLPQVTLPYKYICGSVQDRDRNSVRLVNELYKSLSGRLSKHDITLPELQKVISKTIPHKVNLVIKDMKDKDFEAASDIRYSPLSGKIISTTLEIDTNGTKKVSIINLPSILHEFRHVTDQLFHPKILKKNEYMSNANLYTEKYNNLYDDFFYREEVFDGKYDKKRILKNLEYKFKKLLRKLPSNIKLDYIDDTRYALMLERAAYKTQLKYAKKMQKAHFNVNEDDLLQLNDVFMFDEKIKMLERMAFDIIKKDREIFASKIKKTN